MQPFLLGASSASGKKPVAAIAVPIVVVFLAFVFIVLGFLYWRKRTGRKHVESKRAIIKDRFLLTQIELDCIVLPFALSFFAALWHFPQCFLLALFHLPLLFFLPLRSPPLVFSFAIGTLLLTSFSFQCFNERPC